MSKRFFLTLIMALTCKLLAAQSNKLDSMEAAYKRNGQDSTLVELLINKGIHYRGINPDSGMLCLKKGMALAHKINYKRGVTGALNIISLYHFDAGDLAQSMKIAFELLPQAQAINDQANVWGSYSLLGLDYFLLQDYGKAVANTYKSANVAREHHLYYLESVSYYNLCFFYIDRKNPDSASYFYRKLAALKKYTDLSFISFVESGIALLKGNYTVSISAGKQCIRLIPGDRNYNQLGYIYLNVAEAYQKLSRSDSSLFFAKRSYEYAIQGKRPVPIIESAGFLSDYYQKVNDYKNAFYYQQITLKAKDSLYNQRKALQVQSVTEEESQRKRQAETDQETYRTNVRLFSLLGVLGVVIVVASILLRNNRQRKKANILLSEQKQALQNTLNQLKTTQTQLIQSEKMASLGELTAGIAHEIQNPLNFVNNFSEVSAEMVDEMDAELDKGDITEAKAIAGDIKQNLEKIRHHGKRADSIVKGMLEHSRVGTGEKQPTDLNVLADEFLKLSYHGLQAKDKNFNAELVTIFDPNLPKANVVQQDIGRVLVNIFNNAFYAVNQKQKISGADYKPEVIVSTSAEINNFIISVKDNGNGIPDAIKDKIMQPFFTTKPTGEGTGLGLSLSYDIVVKGHGGNISVNTKEGEFTEFTITLSVLNNI